MTTTTRECEYDENGRMIKETTVIKDERDIIDMDNPEIIELFNEHIMKHKQKILDFYRGPY